MSVDVDVISTPYEVTIASTADQVTVAGASSYGSYGLTLLATATKAAALALLGLTGLQTTGITGDLTLTKPGSTARTATFPDAAITVAGTNVDNAWSVSQSFGAGLAIKSGAQNTYLDWIAGTTGGTDPRIRGYGSAHATLANRWEYAANAHTWYAGDGTTERMSLGLYGITLGSSTYGDVAIVLNTDRGAGPTYTPYAKLLTFQTEGNNRWQMGAVADNESGANAGSTWGIYAYDDAGTYIDNPIFITRAAGGNISFQRSLAMAASLAVRSGVQNSYLDFIAGTTGGTDPRIRGYGSTHATLANRWEYAATTHSWYAANGTSALATLYSGVFKVYGNIWADSNAGFWFGALGTFTDGMWSPSSGTLNIRVGSDTIERMVLAAGGLTYSDTGDVVLKAYRNSTVGAILAAISGGAYIGSQSNHDLLLCSNNTTRVTINAAGTLMTLASGLVLSTSEKITAKVAVPGSFADLAAVQSYLASILN